MRVFFKCYAICLLTYLVLDGIWLGLVAKNTYLEAMEGLMREEYPVAPWVLFYLLYNAAIVYLVVRPFDSSRATQPRVIAGVVLGMAAYGAYNLTNYAIIEGWPLGITITDWLWGTFVTTATASVSWLIHKKTSNSMH